MVDAVARDVLLESDFASLSMSFFQIIDLAQTIIDCNDLFVEAKFMLRANFVNIYSSKANPGEYIFDEWMATTGLPPQSMRWKTTEIEI
ncbi:hypothetical protein BFW01_g2060 [Lasiodiplodia theobromae]|nr:hypothetical protein BFW01_g2060 [Lasiodiplodia theobromae]